MRQLRRLIFTLACISCTLTTWAAYNGTPKSPQKITSTNYSQYGFNASNWGQFNGWYAISSAEELYGFATLVNGGETTANGVLTTNIVVNADVLDSNGNPNGTPAHTWTPIGGTNSKTFKGTFDGNGHTVSGLYYKSNTESYVGLISTCGGGAIIRNVGVVDSYLYGQGAMGGICGFAYNPTGGLPYPIIKNCYNASTITAAYKYGGECGGILGSGYASITNCYNIGTVTATVKGYCHSICGKKQGDAYYERNYYLSTKEADNYATSMPASLFANGTVASLLNDPSEPPAWFQTISEDAYPVLDKTHDEVSSIVLVSESNRANYGLSSDYIGYFAISNKDELYSLAEMVNNGYFNIKAVLANDIVVNNDVLDSDGNLNDIPDNYWTPIGTYFNNFSGTFDGNGHTVSGLYFDNTSFSICPAGGNYVGLIGYATNATIKNVGVIDSYIKGNHPVGGICGYSFKSTIKNCYCTSTIVGTIVGGILGEDNSSSTIANCYFASSSTITNCDPICGGYNNNGSYSKNYYLETSISDLKATLMTAEQFESGYVAYLLNGSSLSGTVWRQNIGQNGDKYPVLDITHNMVSGYTTESNDVITVTGNMVLSNDFVIPSGKTLKILAGASVTTTGTAVITNNGTIVCNGDIYGNNLAGSGTFKTEKLADADIAMASSYEYKGSSYTVENGLNVTINANRTICGKTFTFDNAAYTVSYSNNRNVGTGAKVTWKGPSGTFTKSFSITVKTLTVTIASVANKVYDGNTTAQGTISTEGIVTGDNVTVSHTATFADKTIGTGKTVTFSYAKSGTDAGNYVFASATGTTTANITAKTLTVTIASVANKVYDANTTAQGTISTEGIVTGDDVTVSHTATFADKNVGTGKTVTFSYTKSGADAGNYAFYAESGTTTANITAKTITVTIASVSNKVYDANTTAQGAISTEGIVTGDDVTVSHTATFADKNVGTGKTVTFSYTKSGADAGNYAFDAESATTNADITARTLTLNNFTVADKTYDGTINASEGSFKDDRYNGDELEFSYSYAFADKNAGSGKTVNFTNIAISGGADAGNYNLVTTTSTAIAKISPKAITLRDFKANDKDYDGKATAEGSFSDNRVSGDNLKFAYTCTFDNKNVGKDKTVTIEVTSIESGADKENYSFTAVTNSTAKAEIRAIALTLSGFSAQDKTYDGLTTAQGTLTDNRIAGDDLTISFDCNFDNKNVGTDKTVTFSNIAISGGADAGNYNLVTKSGSTNADIAARTLTLSSFAANDKDYDGKTTAIGSFSDNRVSGDQLEFAYNCNFADKNAGSGKTVNFTSIAISGGADAGNYNLVTTTGTAIAKILPKAITLRDFKANDKDYDGKATAEGSFSDNRVSGDNLKFAYTCTFDNKNVGKDKTVTIKVTSIESGADKENYSFTAVTNSTAKAEIRAIALTLSGFSAQDKTYDGLTTAQGTLTDNRIAGDDLTISFDCNFDNKNVGTDKTVTFSNIAISGGADASNYNLVTTTGTKTANITVKTLTLYDFAVDSKTYDGTTTATNGKFSDNRETGDDLTFTFDCNFDNKNVGTNKTVKFSNIAISGGADMDNYTLATTSGYATASISKRDLALNDFKAESKTYDGLATAEGSFSDERVTGDELTFSFNCNFEDADAKSGKTVNFTNIAISGGADAGNYNLVTTTGTATADITPFADEVVVTIALKDKTVMYNGAEQTYKYEESLETASSNSLYAVSFDNISATAQPEVKGTNVGEYAFGWKSTNFSNINTNFSNVRFDITDAKLTIEPYIYAEVYVTENSDNVVYDSTEHVVSGYMLTIADTTGKLAESDIEFIGDSIVKATAAGVYDMNVLASDFANTNTNFSNVKFNVVDGQLTISKAAEPGTMPESSMETYYLKTHFIGLPANWAWAEDADLNIGSNSAVANYVGADAGNYVKESQTVSINRVACPHSEGSVVYDSLPATCTHRGYTGNLSCMICGEIYEMGDSTEMLPHTPVTDAAVAATCHSTGLSEGSHCSVCGTVLVAQVETAKIAHTPVVDAAVAATCTATGLSEGSHCSVCDSVLVAQVELPALGHKIEIMASVSATCSATGLTEGQRCSVCGDTLVAQEIIPMLPHTIVVMAGVSPTCTATGLTEGKKCSVCGEIIVAQEVIPALGHTIVVDAAVAATCTEDGLTEGSHCSVCGEVIKAQESVPATGHSFTNYIYNNDATFDADGTETAECDHGCGETHTRTAESTKLETAIDAAAADEVVIYAHHNVIVVKNAVSEIRIYDVTGRCVAICGNEKIDKVRTEIAMEGQGLYIVKSGYTVKRVVLK